MTKYYELLDVAPDATPEQIKAAYRILAQLHHPDRLLQVSPQVRHYAEERLKKINEAYAVLSDPARRAKYDAQRRKRAAETDEAPPAARAGRAKRSPAGAAYAEARDWMRAEAERQKQEQAEARRRRAQQEAEAERYEGTARAQRAAQEQYPRARAQGNHLVVHFAPGVWSALVRIPAGEFVMGADPQRDRQAADNEFPQHRVHLAEYYLGKYPVTNLQYQIFVNAAPARLSAASTGWQAPPGKETHPAVNIPWDDARAFCQWLSATTGQPFRLPSEAEWEKGARGPAGEPHASRIYPWGDEWDPARVVITPDGPPGDTQPIGSCSPLGDSPYGIADLCGNVWEWCADWYDAKLYQARWQNVAQDPSGPEAGLGYVVRGGAFDSVPKQLRCSRRNWYYPDNAKPNLGFRIAASLF